MADDNEIRELEQRLRDPATVRQAFTDAIQRFSEPLYWQIRRMVGNHDDADDLLQNTFMKAWSAIENFRRTYTESIDTPEAASVAAPSHFDGEELAGRLRMAVDTLPPKQKLVFNMKYFDDMKYERISEILGTSVGALKASYHSATKKIENFFGGE